MNTKICLATVSLALAFTMVFSPALASVTPTLVEVFGHDFTEDKWAVEFDVNGNLFWDSSDSPPGNWTTVRDVSNLTNSAVHADGDNFDQQFYMAYANMAGIDNAYLALEHVSGDIVINAHDINQLLPNLPINLGLVNATAPFQSFIQHYTSYNHEVFVANTFNAFVAYSTTLTDPLFNGNEDTYLGYTAVADRLITFINSINNTVMPDIPAFNYHPIWQDNGNAVTIGMEYENILIFWQRSTPQISGNFGPLGTHNIPTRGVPFSFEAITLIPKITFKYVITTQDIVDTALGLNMTIANTKFEYDLEPVSLMFTVDDLVSYNNLLADGVCNATNSFHQTPTPIIISAGGYTFTAKLPEYSVFVDEAAHNRIRARAGTDNSSKGFGIAAAYTTNFFDLGYTITVNNPGVPQTGITYPVMVGENKIFATDFAASPTYDLTLDNGTVETNPLYVGYYNPATISSYFNNAIGPYFGMQYGMTGGFLCFSAYNMGSTQLQNQISNPAGTASSIGMTLNQAACIWMLQCGEWNGLKINMDPTFSAVSTASAVDTSAGDGTPEEGIPGFEMLVALAALPILVAVRRRH